MVERTVDIERGRDAVAREAWAEAYEALNAIEPSELEPADLEGLAEAQWWRADIEASIATRQRAHSAYLAAGETARAAYMAIRLCLEHFLRDELSVSAGWFRRAGSLLEEHAEVVEHAYLAMTEGTLALRAGDVTAAVEHARRGREIGRRLRDPNAWAMSTVIEGMATMAWGSADEGLGLLDEAMAAAVTGELSAYFTGAVYCTVIDACLQISDLRRAGEWSVAAQEWCRSIPAESPYPGQCRVNRAEVAWLLGEWREAEAEAVRATDEMLRFSPPGAAAAFARVAEVRLRRGDLEGAEEAFGRAHALGLDAQPGIAQLRLAQGKTDAARTALRVALAGDPSAMPPGRRAALLAARVEAELAGGDPSAAADAADELLATSEAIPIPALRATADAARGSVALATGPASEALERFRRACATWQQLRLPYQTARARMGFALALRAAGDEEDAAMELRAALAGFERLGAAPDAAAVGELLGEPRGLPAGLTPREAEVLRLVASGRTNRDIAVELVLSEHTVARHLQNIFAKIGVSSRSAATAFAFEHELA